MRTWIPWGHSKKVTIYEPGRRPWPETNSARTLILNFHSPELWESWFLLFQLLPFMAFSYGNPGWLKPALWELHKEKQREVRNTPTIEPRGAGQGKETQRESRNVPRDERFEEVNWEQHTVWEGEKPLGRGSRESLQTFSGEGERQATD